MGSPAAPLPVVCALIERDGRVLVARRPLDKHLGNLWEFPGGKIDPGETPAVALQREIREELDAAILIERHLGVWQYHYPTVSIALHALTARLADPAAPLNPTAHTALAWVEPAALAALNLAPADVPIAAAYAAAR